MEAIFVPRFVAGAPPLICVNFRYIALIALNLRQVLSKSVWIAPTSENSAVKLSVSSPALILSKNSGISWLKSANFGSKSAKFG